MFSETLKAAMTEAEVGARALAVILGLPESAIDGWLSGRKVPSEAKQQEILEKISEVEPKEKPAPVPSKPLKVASDTGEGAHIAALAKAARQKRDEDPWKKKSGQDGYLQWLRGLRERRVRE